MRCELVLTMGASPLPVAVAALDHQERVRAMGTNAVAMFHLVFTPEVAPLADRVRAFLERHGLNAGQLICAHDHWHVPRLLEALKQADLDWSRCALHYTGGTKLLSTHVRRYWQGCGNDDHLHEASYLAASGRLWRDSGHSEAVSEAVRLSVDELSSLHFGVPPEAGDDFRLQPRAQAAKQVHANVKSDGLAAYLRLLPPLYGEGEDGWGHKKLGDSTLKLVSYHAAHTSNFKDGAVFGGWDMRALSTLVIDNAGGLDAIVATLDLGGNGKAERRKKTVTWLYGDWLEVWLAGHLIDIGLFHEVRQDVKATRCEDDRPVEEFQADVVGVRGHHAVLFTCTVERKGGLLKQKLFEGLSRGARLGGEHARVALVCMTADPTAVLRQVQELGWDGYDEVRVFGEAHVRGQSATCSLDRAGSPGAPMTLDEALRGWLP